MKIILCTTVTLAKMAISQMNRIRPIFLVLGIDPKSDPMAKKVTANRSLYREEMILDGNNIYLNIS